LQMSEEILLWSSHQSTYTEHFIKSIFHEFQSNFTVSLGHFSFFIT